MSLESKANELVEEFSLFENWIDKYNHIIELGKESESFDEELKEKKFLISGCQSQVWLVADYKDGKMHLKADSDAIITKGIVQLLLKVVDGEKAADVADFNFEFVEQIGLKEHLSPTRSNGLTSMIKQIKMYALVYKTKYESN